MKKLLLILLMLFILAACSPIVLNTDELIQDTDCYEEGIHPIALSIAEDYSDITDYDEVMIWFCNGAEFEDIMNALLTEEMAGSDAEDLLVRLADGETWNDIWIDLGVVEE